jgi:transcription elongation factor Elf1
MGYMGNIKTRNESLALTSPVDRLFACPLCLKLNIVHETGTCSVCGAKADSYADQPHPDNPVALERLLSLLKPGKIV